MRRLVLAGAALLLCGAAAAQPAAPTLPKAFAEYGQPDITPGLCKNLDPTRSQCVIPAMTAGLYEITAGGASTATAAAAVQKITIEVGQSSCGSRQTNPKTAWPVRTPKTLRYSCVVNILTDRPLIVMATYADVNATKDSRGPTLSLKRLPWSGVMLVQPGAAAQE